MYCPCKPIADPVNDGANIGLSEGVLRGCPYVDEYVAPSIQDGRKEANAEKRGQKVDVAMVINPFAQSDLMAWNGLRQSSARPYLR